MAEKGQELEVKFYVGDGIKVQEKLRIVKAQLAKPRQHEANLRFDTADRALSRSMRALRLRQDQDVRLTYKGPPLLEGGARLRDELEFSVSDFDMAKAFLQALGYEVSVMYEKYRTTYHLDNVEVTFDEMPYGNFVEIEGPDGKSLLRAAELLGLDWSRRCLESYLTLFDNLHNRLGLEFNDLSFANFDGLVVGPEDLGVKNASGPAQQGA